MMRLHTSMRVGGAAAFYFEPENEAGLILCIHALRHAGIPYFLLGAGTNVIVRDGGFPGAVISTVKALPGVCMDGGFVCGAGESLAYAARSAACAGLSGLEALSGIPGTIGGAVYMNAGAYGHEIAEVLVSVRAYELESGEILTLSKADCDFGYRSSLFKTRAFVILSATFALPPRGVAEIEAEMAAYTRLRNEKQPVEFPSAGSFFKRPEGDYAGRLLEAAGMKGRRVGGAQISEKHAGFIVNTGGATASDVLTLAEMAKSAVREQFQIELEEEPIIIGVS